jgi:hypothetical protein
MGAGPGAPPQPGVPQPHGRGLPVGLPHGIQQGGGAAQVLGVAAGSQLLPQQLVAAQARGAALPLGPPLPHAALGQGVAVAPPQAFPAAAHGRGGSAVRPRPSPSGEAAQHAAHGAAAPSAQQLGGGSAGRGWGPPGAAAQPPAAASQGRGAGGGRAAGGRGGGGRAAGGRGGGGRGRAKVAAAVQNGGAPPADGPAPMEGVQNGEGCEAGPRTPGVNTTLVRIRPSVRLSVCLSVCPLIWSHLALPVCPLA